MAVKILGARMTIDKGYTDSIAANSLNVDNGTLITYAAATGAAAAAAGETIAGVSVQDKTFASDNFSTVRNRVLFVPTDALDEVLLPVTGGTVTVADEGKFYDLTTAHVDGTTESTTTGQVKLTKFISASLCWFAIVNA